MQKSILIKLQTEGFDKLITSADSALAVLNDLEKSQAELQKQLQQTDTGSENYAVLKKALDDTAKAISQLKQEVATSSFADAFNDLTQSVKQTNTQTQDLTNTFSDLGTTAQDSVTGTTLTLRSMKNELADVEEQLEDVEIGSQEFIKLNTRAEQLKKQMQALALEGEAVALGFKGIGNAGSSIEGLEVKMQSLLASLSFVTDELEKEGIQQQIQAIKFEVEDLEAQAKQGIFPKGSFGALQAEAEALELQLRRLPVGSENFNVVKQRLDDINVQMNFVSQSAIEQKQLFRDLGTSVVSTFGTSLGLLASFAGDSKDAQEALLVLQQTMAAVDLLQQAMESLRLARQAQKITALQAENASIAENTALNIANAGAQGKVAGGLQATEKATKVAGSGFRTLWATILANPIGAVLAVLAVFGAVIVGLSRKFKPLGDAVNFVKDSFSGVVGAVKNVVNNFDAIVDVFKNLAGVVTNVLNPINNMKRVLNTLGADFEVESIKGKIDDLANSATKAGETIANGFQKGFDKARALRALDARQALNEATKNASQLAEAELGSSRSTSDARRAIRLNQLAEDRAIALQRIKLENDLTDAELAILRSGNKEKIKELSKVVDARGEVNEEVLKQLTDLAGAEKEIINEQQNAFQEYIQDQIGLVDLRTQAQLKALDSVVSFANKEQALQTTLNAELKKLDLQRRAGEFKTAEEYNLKKLALEKQYSNDLQQLQLEQQQFRFDLAKADQDFQIAQNERRLELQKTFGKGNADAEIETIKQIEQIRLTQLDSEKALLESDVKNREANTARIAEIEREKVTIQQDSAKAVLESQLSAIDKYIQAQQTVLELQQMELEIAKQRSDNENKIAGRAVERIQESIDIQKEVTYGLDAQLQLLEQQKGLLLENQEVQLNTFAKTKQEQLDAIALEEKRLSIELERLRIIQQTQGALTAEQENQRKLLEAQLSVLEGQKQTVEVDFQINTEKAKAETDKGMRDISNQAIDTFTQAMSDPLDNKLSEIFGKAFGNAGGLVKDLAGQIAGQLTELFNNLEQAQIANIERQAENVQGAIDKAQERIDLLNEASATSLENIQTLEDQINASRGANQEALKAQLNNEQKQRDGLQKQLRDQEKEKKRFEQEAIALEERKKQIQIQSARRQKAIAIAQAVANTALAITNTIATVPKLDFGVSTGILVALYTALGAAQIATIASQPDPAREGGFMDSSGNLMSAKSYADGGMLQGASHEGGGIPIIVGGRVPVEAEGGEAIISKRATSRNRPVISTLINEGAYRDFDLVERPKFASGGILDISPSPNVVNSIQQSSRQSQTERIENAISQIELQPVLAVDTLNDVQNRVRIIDNSSSL